MNTYNRFISDKLRRRFFLFLIIILPYNSAKIYAENIGKTNESTKIIVFEENKIRINADGQTLAEILQAVQIQSTILFDVSSEIQDDHITTTVSAKAWPAIIRKLLIGYNRVGIWDKDGNLLRVSVVSPVGKESYIPVPARSRDTPNTPEKSLPTKTPTLPPQPPPKP